MHRSACACNVAFHVDCETPEGLLDEPSNAAESVQLRTGVRYFLLFIALPPPRNGTGATLDVEPGFSGRLSSTYIRAKLRSVFEKSSCAGKFV